MPLNPRFQISTAAPAEMDEVMRVMETAYANDGVWKYAIENCDKADIHEWVMNTLASRWNMPDITTYKCVEISTGKIVAWTALQSPWNLRKEEMSTEMKDMALSHDIPSNLPKGIFIPALVEFFNSLNGAFLFGYDPEEDYHRKGTMVLPTHQRLGLATALTQYTNTVSDKQRIRTWAPARSTSHKMFNDNGFVDIGTVDAETERWGGDRVGSITFIVKREAVVGEGKLGI